MQSAIVPKTRKRSTPSQRVPSVVVRITAIALAVITAIACSIALVSVASVVVVIVIVAVACITALVSVASVMILIVIVAVACITALVSVASVVVVIVIVAVACIIVLVPNASAMIVVVDIRGCFGHPCNDIEITVIIRMLFRWHDMRRLMAHQFRSVCHSMMIVCFSI